MTSPETAPVSVLGLTGHHGTRKGPDNSLIIRCHFDPTTEPYKQFYDIIAHNYNNIEAVVELFKRVDWHNDSLEVEVNKIESKKSDNNA